jgi:hypothetical protein
MKNLSVRELVKLLKDCPDQDAYVVIPNGQGAITFLDDAKPRLGKATVELQLGRKGYY